MNPGEPMNVRQIQIVANTTGKRCPLLRGRKCLGDACAFWMAEQLETEQQGVQTVEGCMLVIDHAYHVKGLNETIRVSASLDKVANVGKQVMTAMERQATVALLAGQPLIGVVPH